MRIRSSHSGFSAVEIVIVVAVVAVLGFLGYTFYNSYQQNLAKVNSSSATVDDTEAPAITTASDLDTASKTLDDSDLESNSANDLSELDKDLSAF